MAVTKFTLFAVILVVLLSAVTAQFGVPFGGPGFGGPGYGSFGPGLVGGYNRPGGFGGHRPGFGGYGNGYGQGYGQGFGQGYGQGFGLFRRR